MAALSATLPHAPRAVHNTHSGAYEQAPLSPEAHAAATVAAVFVSALHKVQRQKPTSNEVVLPVCAQLLALTYLRDRSR